MDSNIESLSPDNAYREPSFRKGSSDKANRKYRRHSSVSGSGSSSSDGSPKHGRSPSPTFTREEPTRVSDGHLRRKTGARDWDNEYGRSRFDQGGDSHRHSDKLSYRSSHDHHRHGDYNRYRKLGDEGERSYHRSSGYGRESRSDIHSDRKRQGNEHDKLRDYQRKSDEYAQEHRGNDKNREERKRHKDNNPITERATSGRRHTNSYVDDSKPGELDRCNKDEGRDDMKNRKSSGDRKSDSTYSVEEGTGHEGFLNVGKESYGIHLKETQKSYIKDLSRPKGDTVEKRKFDDRESDIHKERFSKRTDEKDYSTSKNRKSYGRDEQYQDNPTRISKDSDFSPKKLKSFNLDKEKRTGKDGYILPKTAVAADVPPSGSKLSQETIGKTIAEPAQTSKDAENNHDFNAAKVAAMKAAELVNKNLVGSGFMSTDQKKKLLWGSKKNTAVEEPGHRWDVPLFTDQERQEKFNKLMSLRLPWCLWPIVGCEGRCETSNQTRQQGGQWTSPGRETGAAPAGFREAIHCWTPTKRWSHRWSWSVISSNWTTLTWVSHDVFFHSSVRKNHAFVVSFSFQIFGKRWRSNFDKPYSVFLLFFFYVTKCKDYND